MSKLSFQIPPELEDRDRFYRDVIPYIHLNILRLTPISGADDTWLSDKLVAWIPSFDNAKNPSITNEDFVAERDALDVPIYNKLEIVIGALIPWTPLTATDKNHFGIHERVDGNATRTVVNRAPSTVILGQSHLGAKVKAIDPLNPNATKIPDGVFLVIWVGYTITDPITPNPDPVFLGWSASIEANLKFSAHWLKKDGMIQAYYVDKHHNESDISTPIPIFTI